MTFFVSRTKFGHWVVIEEDEKELLRCSLAAFLGTKLSGVIKVEIKNIDDYGFVTYKVLNENETKNALKEYYAN